MDLNGVLQLFSQAALSDTAGTGVVDPAITQALGLLGYSNPYSALGELAWSIIQRVFGIPDPLSLLLGALSGRPTMQATSDIAQTLHSYSSPPLQLMALGAAALVQQNIPISSPAADPIFGKCFAGAVWLEQAIRWRNFTTQLGTLEATTLQNCLHEAGNPGVAGTTTLLAVQQAWNDYPAQDPNFNAMRTIAAWPQTDPGRMCAKRFAAKLVGNLPTPPPGPPPPPPPTGAVYLNVTPGQTITGAFWEVAEVVGGPFPTANVVFYRDAVGQASVPAGTSNPSTGLWVGHVWDSTHVPNGNYTLRADWQGTLGTVHASVSVPVTVLNQTPQTITTPITAGQSVSGTAVLGATVQGGPDPNASVKVYIDGQNVLTLPAHTIDGTTPLNISANWDSTRVSNGTHSLRFDWVGQLGALHSSVTVSINVQNVAPPAPSTITINLTANQTVSGNVALSATVQGGPDPNASVHWLIDAQEVATHAAGTQDGTTPLTVSGQWDSTTVTNGNHSLNVQWKGQLGAVHAQTTITINVQNGGGPGPGPGPTQTIDIPIFETDFQQCCAETQASLKVIAQAVTALPAAWTALNPGTPGANYTAVLTAISGFVSAINVTLGTVVTSINSLASAEASANASISALPNILNTLSAVAHSLSDIDQQQPSYLSELDCICKAIQNLAVSVKPTDVSGVVDQLKTANALQDVPQPLIDMLISMGMLPSDPGQLAGGGPWTSVSTALSSIWHRLNHPPTKEELAAIKADPLIGPIVTRVTSGTPLPSFKEVLKMTPTVIGGIAAEVVSTAMEATFPVAQGLLGQIVQTMLKIHEDLLAKYAAGPPGQEIKTASGLLIEAFQFGVAAHWAAVVGETVMPNKELGLQSIAAMLAELAGFGEVIHALIRPEMQVALARPHGYAMNRLYPNALPTRGDAMQWSARRILADSDAQQLFASAGLASTWHPALERARFHPVSPRALATLLQDQPIDHAGLIRILQDNSYADADVSFLATAYEYASLKNVRNSYVGELVQAYAHGVMPDSELRQSLTDLGWSNDAVNLVIQRAALQRRVTLAQKVEQQIIPLVAQGSITSDAGLQQLEAAGVQPWHAELDVTLATTKATIHAAKLEAALEEREARQTQRNLTRAAVAEFQSGTIDAAGLTAQLVLIGLPASLIASIVSVQEAARVGRMRSVYGKLLSPQAAKLLSEQVAAIEQQFKDTLIPEASAEAQLKQLGLDHADITALIARWAAVLKKKPGSAVLLPPVNQ